ncbi:MAG: 3-deoxy-D-manno-octulosonic acid transferase [Sedimentisphaerales bacterium]|nr:3-deoxy-D-manno-octulosonic acid transferase [Sedimentisphaerales bacterium]
MAFQNRYRTGWKERFGFVRPRHNDRPCIWIHAVSMGEINAISTLVEQLRRVIPEFEIIISTTTDTGMARAKKLYGQTHRVFFYPWDFSFAVRRALKRLHPQLVILMELEVWHNFTAVARQLNIPVMVANGRISTGKGFKRYKPLARLVRGMFGRLFLVLAQDEEYARRFRFLGVPAEKIKVVGSLKYDTAEITDTVAGADELAQQLRIIDQRLWVVGSTGPGEEAIALKIFDKIHGKSELADVRLVIVPRKPERFDEVARMIETAGHRLVRYSQVKSGSYTVSDADANAVILGDTMGDLRKFYSLATVVFVGRSLVNMGGSDMMEVAALAKPVIVGPYTDNFAQTMQVLRDGNGVVEVVNSDDLCDKTIRLLLNPEQAQTLALNARRIIEQNRGATKRTIEEIVDCLGYKMPLSDKTIATKSK